MPLPLRQDTRLDLASMDADAFLRWVAQEGDGDYELIDGRVFQMAAERNWHAVYKANVYYLLRQSAARAEADLKAFVDGPGVQIGERTVRVPDAVVNEGPVDEDSLVVPAPVILVEIVSESSERRDHGSKLVEYFDLNTVLHYLIVLHDKQRVIWHHRKAPNAGVETEVLARGAITFDPYDVTIRVEDIFDDSAFE